MTSHFLLLFVFSFFVSLVFGVLLRDDPREQFRTGAAMFGGFIATALVLGWLMYPFPLLRPRALISGLPGGYGDLSLCRWRSFSPRHRSRISAPFPAACPT